MMNGTFLYEKRYSVALVATIGAYLITATLYATIFRENVSHPTLPRIANSYNQEPVQKTFLINYFIPVHYISYRINFTKIRFDSCTYKNCEFTVNTSLLRKSDAVIFHGLAIRIKHWFSRPPDQVWIFNEHEAPVHYEHGHSEWKKGKWRASFNWTMTFDEANTDIFLPYGELKKTLSPVERDYDAIYRNKTGEVLIVTSHCQTPAKRMEFIKELQKYVKVDVKGACGKRWNCGQRVKHDNCFEILNKYKFYLAFENSLCRGYFTEKFYENFKYDTILVVRGGSNGQAKQIFPKNTIISTDNFSSVKELANFLKELSKSRERYTEMLKNKNNYYFPGFKTLYQRALCNICERLNNIDKYRKQIPNIEEWAYGTKPCRKPYDITKG